MKYFMNLINCLLIVAIPAMIVTGVTLDVKTVNTTIDVKKINSLKIVPKEEQPKIEKVIEEEKEVIEEEKQEEMTKEQKIEVKEEIEEPKKEEEIKTEETVAEPVSDVLDTLSGKMSGYGSDCVGCTGYTSSGYHIASTIYYQDKTYGTVRILSADRSLAMGSIVRVKNSKIGSFLGIVLDRGGNVGFGKTYLFDLLFASEKEAAAYGSSSNVVFEVLRKGY